MTVFSQHYNKFLVSAEIIADLVAILSAFSFSTAIHVSLHPTITYRPRFTIVAIITAIFGVLIFERFGLYRQQASIMNLIEIRKIIRATLLLCLGLILYSYFQKIAFPRSLFAYIVISILTFVLTERMLFFKLQQSFYIRHFCVRRVLILGAGEKGRLLHQNILQSPKLGYFVVGFFDKNQSRLSQTKEWFSKSKSNDLLFSNDLSNLPEIIKTAQIDEIFISNPLHDMRPYNLQKLAILSKELKVKLNFIPYVIRGYFANELQAHDINGIPIVSLRPIPLSHAEQLSKRIFDLILTSTALLLASPFFLIISLVIYYDSQGPIFFKQIRVGKDGVHFPMYKFRSMYTDTPHYANSPKKSHDPRTTRIGHFLRKTSLDELPQLFNVLRGEMSLVGPRP